MIKAYDVILCAFYISFEMFLNKNPISNELKKCILITKMFVYNKFERAKEALLDECSHINKLFR